MAGLTRDDYNGIIECNRWESELYENIEKNNFCNGVNYHKY